MKSIPSLAPVYRISTPKVEMEQFAKDLRNPFFYRLNMGLKSFFSWFGSLAVSGMKTAFRSSLLWMLAGCGMIAMIGLQERWVDAGVELGPDKCCSGVAFAVGASFFCIAGVFIARGIQCWIQESKTSE